MRTSNLFVVIILLLTVCACKKPEPVDSLNSTITRDKNNSSRVNGKTDSIEYYLNMDKPTRDAILFKKNGGILPSTRIVRTGERKPTTKELAEIKALAVTPTYPDYHCCNDICLTIPEDPYGSYLPFTDIWGNGIKFIGRYGNDPRQMYYVYVPENVNVNSKIVVLVHGGGWITGQDPDQISGWVSAYAPSGTNSIANKQANNMVKNLLLQGFVVVVPLYRLVAYGNTTADILATPITVQDQVDDIDAAITHIKTNFTTCLWKTPLNVNNIQVLGESAGANLALLFAYTKANTNYIKSVVSVAGPTNLNQFSDFIKSKNLINPLINQNCGQPFIADNWNSTNATHLPFYGPLDPIDDYNNKMLITNVTNFSNITCTMPVVYFSVGAAILNFLPYYLPATARRGDNYYLAQSCVRQISTTPLTSPAFTAISPRFQLNTSRIIPTFVIHGTMDRIVPYVKATDGMETALTNNGGLIGIFTSPNYAPTNYYATPKHLVKKYTGADHNVADFQDPNYSANTGPSQTQNDILKWLNGH